MTRVFRSNPTLSTLNETIPTLWGYDAHDLHDAYWRSQGIQCVRRTEPFIPQRGRDLFMLLEPRQCTVFDRRELANAMAWNRAPLSRIRVSGPARPYVERVIKTEHDELVRIARDYGGSRSNSSRILMTQRASMAQVWANSESRRRAWTELRRYVDWTRTDHYSVEGFLSNCDDPESAQALMEELVGSWAEPGLVIDGLVQIRPGIWAIPGTNLGKISHIVAPAWIGQNDPSTLEGVVVGPVAIPDDANSHAETPAGLRLLAIDEIMRTSNQDPADDEAELSIYAILKRMIDVVVSLIMLLVLSPLLVVVAIAIALNDGWPVFFGHTRQTRGGREFKCWKFRTMLRNAEAMVPDLTNQDRADGPQVFIEDDPRITKIGKFLRRFHIDELPQFWNVLIGDMSLVGPRPSPESENQFCPAWRDARLSVRPGITGLWQVERTRAPGMDFQEWIKYDIKYVNRASLLLDLRICVKTLVRMIRG